MTIHKVLVVDDSPTDLANIKTIVADSGYTVLTAIDFHFIIFIDERPLLDGNGLRKWASNRYPSSISTTMPDEHTGFPRCAGTHRDEAHYENHLWQRHCQAFGV